MTQWKTCKPCGVRQEIDAFGRNVYAKDGRHYYCKTCAAMKRKDWYERNKAKARAATDKWKLNMAATNAAS